MEDQAVNIVSQIGKRDLCVGATQADRADEQPHLILLPGEDMFDAGANGGPGGVGAGGVGRHRLAPRLLAMDAADPPDLSEPRLVVLAAIGGVGPDIRSRIVAGDDIAQHPPVESGAIGDLALSDEPEAPTDRNAAFKSKAWDGDVDPRLAVGHRPGFRERQRPAGVGILLCRLLRVGRARSPGPICPP